MMKRMKQAMALILAVIIMITAGAVVNPAIHAKAKSSKKSITLNYEKYTLKKGKTLKLKATTSSKKAVIEWSSSKPKIATVSSKGKVKALKKGKVTITARIQGTNKKAKIKIIVGKPVTGITLPEAEKELTIGDEYAMQPVIAPAKASDKKLSYESSDEKVATVDATGKVKAVAAGTATITVSSTDGSKKKATLSVKVKEKEDPTVKVSSITITSEGDRDYVSNAPSKQTLQLTATVLPANATKKDITWSSSDPTKATVDSNGLVKWISGGGEGVQVVITATANDGSGVKKEFTVKIYSQS